MFAEKKYVRFVWLFSVMLMWQCIAIVRNAARRVTDRRLPLSALKARAEGHKDSDERERAVSAVARRGRRDPAIESWLKVRARVDDDLFVRERAMRELVSRWKADPSGVMWLIDTALSGEPLLQRIAWDGLASGWKNDLQIITTLEGRIAAEANAAAREDASKALAVRWSGHPQVSSWLITQAIVAPSDAARRSAGLALTQIGQNIPDLSSHITEHVRSADVVERCRTLDLIGILGPGNGDAWPCLSAAATTDANPRVRGTALGVLARPRWNQHAEASRVVMRLARFDPHWAVRRDAVEWLARSWPRGSQTVSILTERARSDAGWVVRRAALRELVVGWKDHPDTLAIVMESARSQHPAVRETAIQALALRWWRHPDTLPMLKTCARSDQQRSVRNAAVSRLVKRWPKDAEVQQLHADYRASASTTR